MAALADLETGRPGRLNSFQIRDSRIEDLLGRSPIQLENKAIREQLDD
ncbi:hypothetical protein GCM10028803_46540 [Larkinella knui]